MKKLVVKFVKYISITLIILFIILTAAVALHIYNIPKLKPWHTFIPKELTVDEMDNTDWAGYIERENKIFDDIYQNVVLKIPESEKIQINRYFEKSIIFPQNFENDWNRSYMMVPQNPQGAVVMLHGLTDAPYSLRHIAQLYYDKNFVVIGIRAPGHGTTPGALTSVTWQEWIAATRLAVREADKLIAKDAPLHIVGFSKGGAVALKYTLDAIEYKNLRSPDKLVLISPMIGITRLSKLAEIISIPSVIPGFKKAEWLSIIPEFNPFKYNSFPFNAIRQARLLISEIRRQAFRISRNGLIKNLPPVLTFQSIVDYTVSTPAIINDLYSYLPENDNELVLFDINHNNAFMPLVRPVFKNILANMLPDLPLDYKVSIIGNSTTRNAAVTEKSIPANTNDYTIRSLDLTYPYDVFSLSHVALPFPENDSLYGSNPDHEKINEFGINLGVIANAQGERGILQINTNLFFRISSNPFFPYMEERILDIIEKPYNKFMNKKTATHQRTKAKMSEEEYDNIMTEQEYGEAPF